MCLLDNSIFFDNSILYDLHAGYFYSRRTKVLVRLGLFE